MTAEEAIEELVLTDADATPVADPPPEPEAEVPTPPDEPVEPEEAPAEPAEDELTEDVEAPTIVQDLAPSMAKLWPTMSDEDRMGLMGDLVRQIDQGEPQGEGGDTDDKGEATPAKSEPTAQTEAPEATPEKTAPAPMSDAELKAACTEFGIEPDSAAAKFLRSVMEQSAHAVQVSGGVAQDAAMLYRAAKEMAEAATTKADAASAKVMSLADENELVNALEAHTSDFRGMSKADYTAVVKQARKYKEAGRARKYHDAVSIALWERQTEAVPEPSGKARQETAKVASALSKGSRGRGGAKALKIPEGLNTPSEIAEWLDKNWKPPT